jgi:2-C-methyl-D-erythritol 4-phosphate cytidylyltransferase
MKVAALIAAAGLGKRMNSKIGKPFIPIFGKPILAHTLEKFEKCHLINKIFLVVTDKEKEYCQKNIIKKYHLQKIEKLIIGGETRQESVFNGLKSVDSDTDIIVIHDGARPFVNESTIRESIAIAIKDGAAVSAVPLRDTVKRVKKSFFIHSTLDRTKIWRAQTPQTFRYRLIKLAYEKAWENGFIATDDSAILERYGYDVKLFLGSEENIKITSPFDIFVAESILKRGILFKK